MKGIAHICIWISILSISLLLPVSSSFGLGIDNGDWPKEIRIIGGKVVLYQLQPEKIDGNILDSRAALSVEMGSTEGPVFGAVWLTTRLNTDRDDRIAVITDVNVTDVRFPDKEKEGDFQQIKTLLEQEIPKWELEIDLDRLVATLDQAEKREIAAQKINTAPPKIFFVPRPAVLITIDGEPRLRNIENSSLMRVVNTPFTILFSQYENRYFLYAGKGTWYTSTYIKKNWEIASDVPSEVADMTPKQEDADQPGEFFDSKNKVKPGPPPEIYVSTEPAELISCDGDPEFTPISRTNLLYISNTDSDVLMHIMERRYYVLLSGRWYRSLSLDGPWEYVAGNDLPKDFSKIPEDSQMGTVLYAVPGTNVAKEAVLDAYIPQTAAVDPNKASLSVEFDGKPIFEPINSTTLYYAVNSTTPVIWTGRWYYACDQAVWFVAPSPRGPWSVATSVPNIIYTIPPESPVYNVTFVRVYDARPNVVYVGYTPGYTHTYVYYDTIVYGSGYYWPGWYGRYYYPRHWTWGYHPRWNPWAGWAFGISYSTGPFHFYIGTGNWYRGGWWGPSYYRSYRHGYYHRHRRAKHVGYRAGYRAGYRDGRYRDDVVNIYRGKRNKSRVVKVHKPPKPPGIDPGGGIGIRKNRPNNVYVDQQGNVYRRTDKGWQKRKKDKWQQHKTSDPSRTGPGIGAVPAYRQKNDDLQQFNRSEPIRKPIQTERPKAQKVAKPSRPQPSIGIGSAPAYRSKDVKAGQYRSEPSRSPVQKKRSQGKKDVAKPSRPQPSIGIGSAPAYRSKGKKVEQYRTQPTASPAQTKKPQQNKSKGKSPAQGKTDQLDQSHNARQQGANRAQSFSGTVRPGRGPSSGLGGGGGRRR